MISLFPGARPVLRGDRHRRNEAGETRPFPIGVVRALRQAAQEQLRVPRRRAARLATEDSSRQPSRAHVNTKTPRDIGKWAHHSVITA